MISEKNHSPEEDYFAGSRRAERKERRRIMQADRSKYKKTDQDKIKKGKVEAIPQGTYRGRVLSISSRGIIVDSDGVQYMCTLRGILKKEKTRQTKLAVVGDFVHFDATSDGEGIIRSIEPRRSILSRADNLARTKEQYIAANIDQVLITVSVVNPTLKPSLVDRYIISSIKGSMQPIVIVNKVDLLQDAAPEVCDHFNAFVKAYTDAGIVIIPVSTVTGQGLESLRMMMKDKASVFAGQSGVGKSSLINAVTGLDLLVGETVDRTRKGAHTTTQSQLIPLKCKGWCIDTPGIQSFGMWELQREEIAGYYADISRLGKTCRFNNCLHLSEPGCAVIEAVEKGALSQLRYVSYRNLIEEVDEEHRRR